MNDSIRCPELRATFGDFYSDLNDNERRLVREDVREIMAEEDCDYAEACVLLRGRIGGASVLPSYVACLVAGEERRNK